MKNMKKYLLIAFAAIASFTACDFLDRGPLSDMTEEIYFKTAEDFQLFTNPLYKYSLSPSSIFKNLFSKFRVKFQYRFHFV